MKWEWLILTTLTVGCVLFAQSGCEEQAELTPVSKAVLRAHRPAVKPAKARAVVPDVNAPAPKIVFEKVVHDFGKIGPKTKNTCEFKFKNAGDGLLKITSISKTCGCTPYTLSKKEYAPGESGTLKVKYNAGSHAGSASKRLFVSSNDRQKPKVTLTVKAKIVLKVDYKPKRISLSLKEENAGCPDITISSLVGQPFAIKSFKSTANCIIADVNSSAKATEFVLRPKVDVERLRKTSSGRISIGLTHPGTGVVSIPFEALARFKINPPVISILKAEPQKPIIRKVWILDNYREDFEIESTASEKGTVRVMSRKKVKNGYEFELEITPPTVEGKKRFFTDVFFVNVKDGEKLKITCRGFYPKKKKKS
jgi:hypothetical protein